MYYKQSKRACQVPNLIPRPLKTPLPQCAASSSGEMNIVQIRSQICPWLLQVHVGLSSTVKDNNISLNTLHVL